MTTRAADVPKDVVGVAIVGGGISGLYCGWRLLTGKQKDGGEVPRPVVVFESSPRTGGRLLTWHPLADQDPYLNAELGGMRFFPEQELVWKLVGYFVGQEKLKPPIPFLVADPNKNNLWYLRETLLKAPDLTDPQRLPFHLGKYDTPDAILNGVIDRVLAANRKVVRDRLGGKTKPTNWKEWDLVKPHLTYRARRLWDVGFWNLLWDLLSPETYAYVTDASGYYSLTNNWNAAEAMQVLSTDFTLSPKYHTLEEGFDTLPHLVREEFEEAGGKVLLERPVVSVDRGEGGLYHLQVKGVNHPVRARHVILAMPRRSLELLKETRLWNLDSEIRQGGKGLRTLGEHVRSVIPYPAFKLFLVYRTPWWRKQPISIAGGRSVCDLPLRQTYYFPPVPDGFPTDDPPLKGPGLVMASYDDMEAVLFWRMLEAPDDMKETSNQLMGQRQEEPRRAAAVGASPRLRTYAAQDQEALIQDRGFFFAPPEMVRYAQKQLRMVHGDRPVPDPLPLPSRKDRRWFLAAYKDWGVDPFGGGWNFWAPLVDVRGVMQQMRRPFPKENLYIVGEAYSGAQGWVEGALTTAEKMLRKSFGLDSETWQPGHYYMGY
jgi:monoamine oxidase